MDAARKLVILASIAFNTRIDLSDVLVEGIDGLDLCDIEHGKELGYAIKLLAIAKNNAEHGISVCVRPTMLPVSHPLAGVNDVFNAIFVTGDAIGDAMFMGRGAGKMPTASAVCGDIIDVARNIIHKSNGRINCTCFDEKHLCSLENMMSPCYIRLHVQDKPGVLAAIAAAFGAQNVSLKNVVQKSKVKGVAELVVITYDVSELNLQMAVQTLKALPIVEKVAVLFVLKITTWSNFDMKNKITVIVPATSANCGPGYDSLGLACNLYNDFTFEILDTPGFALEVIGEGEDRLRADGRNLAFLSFLKVWNEVRGTRIGLKVTMQNRIPLSRGLGSSSTAIVAGLVAANLLTGSTLPKERLLIMLQKSKDILIMWPRHF